MGLHLPAASAPDRALPASPCSLEEAGPRAGRERRGEVGARSRRGCWRTPEPGVPTARWWLARQRDGQVWEVGPADGWTDERVNSLGRRWAGRLSACRPAEFGRRVASGRGKRVRVTRVGFRDAAACLLPPTPLHLPTAPVTSWSFNF